MVRLLKKPLTWIVLAEIAVVAALIVVAWGLVAATAQASAPPPLAVASTAPDSATPAPALPSLAQPNARQLLPGLNLDSGFWRTRLSELNRDQVFFEQLEWRLVHGAMDAVNRYLETVVLPSLTRAEGKR